MEGNTPGLVKEKDGVNNNIRTSVKEKLVPDFPAKGKRWQECSCARIASPEGYL